MSHSNLRPRHLLLAAALFGAAWLLFPVPTPMDQAIMERAVERVLWDVLDTDASIRNERGLHSENPFTPNVQPGLYFTNDLGIPDTVFLRNGLIPAPTDRPLDIDAGEHLLSIWIESPRDNEIEPIAYFYIFDSLGAYGHHLTAYRILTFKFFLRSNEVVA